jgi:hypothetical protein
MPKPTKTAMPKNAPSKEYTVNKDGTMHKSGRDYIKKHGPNHNVPRKNKTPLDPK